MEPCNVKCPICGTVNKGLLLEETNGWMICEHCQTETLDLAYARQHARKIPLLTMDQLANLAVRKAG